MDANEQDLLKNVLFSYQNLQITSTATNATHQELLLVISLRAIKKKSPKAYFLYCHFISVIPPEAKKKLRTRSKSLAFGLECENHFIRKRLHPSTAERSSTAKK